MRKIRFASSNKYFKFPVIGKSAFPDWYRRMPVIKPGSSMPLDDEGRSTSTFKRCIPVFDSMSSGYFAVLDQDIQVTQKNGAAYLQWPGNPEPVSLRDGTHFVKEAVPAGYSEKAWVWINRLVTSLPKGYSMIICHPSNRYDLPFITLSAVVDADSVMHEGKVPFYLKEGFEGVIKCGTPIFQIIPFKRESWKSIKDESILEAAAKNSNDVRSYLFGWYKKFVWKSKMFIDGINNEKD